MSTVLIALGGSVIVYRFLRPTTISIRFDPYAMFNPSTGSLRIRLHNQFHSLITRAKAEVYLRCWFEDLGSVGMYRTLDVPLKRNVLPRLDSRAEWVLVTSAATEIGQTLSAKTTATGGVIDFHPSHVLPLTELIVFVSGEASDYQSTITASHSYTKGMIRCGTYQSIGELPGMSLEEIVRNRKRAWGKINETDPVKCSDC